MARSACWPALICSPANRSREFVEFLKLLDAAYPAHTAIKLILDNHSAHISKETKAWLAGQTSGRFESTLRPKHGSWLNLVEGFFSKLPRALSCAISASPLNRNSRSASWPPSTTSTNSRRPQLGPTNSTKPLIQTSKAMI
jgi:DDE superfamily endonuclease